MELCYYLALNIATTTRPFAARNSWSPNIQSDLFASGPAEGNCGCCWMVPLITMPVKYFVAKLHPHMRFRIARCNTQNQWFGHQRHLFLFLKPATYCRRTLELICFYFLLLTFILSREQNTILRTEIRKKKMRTQNVMEIKQNFIRVI